MTKYPQKGRGQRPWAEFFNFKTPYLNLEQVELETSNSVYTRIYLGKFQLKHDKIPQKRHGQDPGPFFKILNPLRKLLHACEREFNWLDMVINCKKSFCSSARVTTPNVLI